MEGTHRLRVWVAIRWPVGVFGMSDNLEGDLHLEAIAMRMDVPVQGSLVSGHVCH